MIILILIGLIALFFYSGVVYGFYQNHNNKTLSFYSSSKLRMDYRTFMLLIKGINFDKIEKNHLISRCSRFEKDGVIFRWSDAHLLFNAIDFFRICIYFYFRKNRNSLGYKEKNDKLDKKLILMRGLPGSQKSTKANEIIKKYGGVIHSTDDILLEYGDGDYGKAFGMKIKNKPVLGIAHRKNFYRAVKSMKDGISPVIIDNTNIKRRDFKNYIKEALKMGYSDSNIEIIDIGTNGFTLEELANRNTHGVPLETITKMYNSYISSGSVNIKTLFIEDGK